MDATTGIMSGKIAEIKLVTSFYPYDEKPPKVFNQCSYRQV